MTAYKIKKKPSRLFKAIVFIECLIPITYMFIMRDYMFGERFLLFVSTVGLLIDCKMVGDYSQRLEEEGKL